MYFPAAHKIRLSISKTIPEDGWFRLTDNYVILPARQWHLLHLPVGPMPSFDPVMKFGI